MRKTKQSTDYWQKFWENRDTGDWIEKHWGTFGHPHRQVLSRLIGAFEPFESVLEVGCSVGTNLAVLRSVWPELKDLNLAGIDVNEGVIATAKEHLPAVEYKVGSVLDIPFDDNSFDVVLSDAMLMYVDQKDIKKAMKEMDRVAKKGILLCEWHKERSSYVDDHWAHPYAKLLRDMGYKVTTQKITEETWPEPGWKKNGSFVIAQHRSKTSKKK